MKKVLLFGTWLLTGMLLLSSCNEGRIIYLEPAPVIQWDNPDGSYSLKVGTSLVLSPIVLYDTDAQYQWLMDGQTVGTYKTYEFRAVEPGTFGLTFRVIRENVSVERPVTLHVFDKTPPVIFLAVPADGFTVATGDTLLLNPAIEQEENTRLLWEIDGQEAGRVRTCFFYKETAGTYIVSLLAENEDGSDELLFAVHVINSEDIPPEEDPDTDPPSDKYFRPADPQSAADWSEIFDYTPAPGQFINDKDMAGFSGENTPEKAIQYAQKRLKEGSFVSLGAYGGYLVAGFDHSVVNDGEYNLLIAGNAHENSAEPGIVWVMQDSNGNGLPDDTWYQLKGSEHGSSSTLYEYSVTYFKPREPGKPVYWTDNKGNQGSVDYLGMFHAQDSYYPQWISADSYTLTGTRLESRSYLQSNGTWMSPPFDWGYVDNSDQSLFRISDAVTADGQPIRLDFIDFVKVQTAVNAKAGWLGEISTEVTKICDYNLLK
jgi:hypothetical protein